MGETEIQPDIVSDNASERYREPNVIDNVSESGESVGEIGDQLRREVLKEISEYKLQIIQRFMFGEANRNFGNLPTYINPAIMQAERATYVWMNELSEDARRAIIGYYMCYDGDNRERPYKQYLCSPIWKYTSSVLKVFGGYTCQECGKRSSPAHLRVHHVSYRHVGSELEHLEDLEVLCTDCHMKICGIRRENDEK